jgi:hypothetical protein
MLICRLSQNKKTAQVSYFLSTFVTVLPPMLTRMTLPGFMAASISSRFFSCENIPAETPISPRSALRASGRLVLPGRTRYRFRADRGRAGKVWCGQARSGGRPPGRAALPVLGRWPSRVAPKGRSSTLGIGPSGESRLRRISLPPHLGAAVSQRALDVQERQVGQRSRPGGHKPDRGLPDRS